MGGNKQKWYLFMNNQMLLLRLELVVRATKCQSKWFINQNGVALHRGLVVMSQSGVD